MEIEFPSTPFVGQYIWFEGVRYDWNDVDDSWHIGDRNDDWPDTPDPPSNSKDPLEIEIVIDVEGTALELDYTASLGNTGIFDIKIDWGDGTPVEDHKYTTSGTLSHTYASAGTYVFSITGTMSYIVRPSTASRPLYRRVLNLGDTGTINYANMCILCEELTEFTSGVCNTSLNTTCSGMLRYTTKMTTLDLSTFDTGNVTNMSQFLANTTMPNVDLTMLDTRSVTSTSLMFSSTDILTINLSGWDTSSLTNMSNMFLNSFDLQSVDFTGWDTSNVTNLYSCFGACFALTSFIGVADWNTSNVTSLSSTFTSCRSLVSIDLTNWDTSKVTSFNRMFASCPLLETIIGITDTSSATDMGNMFQQANALTNIDVSMWDTSGVTTMSNMFSAVGESIQIDLRGWDFSDVTNMQEFFYPVGAGTFPQTAIVGGYGPLLQIIAAQAVQPGINTRFDDQTYAAAPDPSGVAHDTLTGAPNNWTITDGGPV